jgi:hypothetical protein
VSIEARSIPRGDFWIGGIVDDVSFIEHKNPKYCRISIRFNRYMVPLYLEGAYSTLSLPYVNSLKAYARRIYEFLMSHEDNTRKMSIIKWKQVLGTPDDVPLKTFKQRLKEGIIELINKGILSEESKIVGQGDKAMIVTILKGQ